MELNLNLRQHLSLSQQMLQSIEILQMSSAELLEFMRELAEENPVVDILEPQKGQDEFEPRRTPDWRDNPEPQGTAYQQPDPDAAGADISIYGEDRGCSLYDYVLSQLNVLRLDESVAPVARYLAGCLNNNGYLDGDLAEIAAELKVPFQKVREALDLIQSLDPPGVGAKDLKECLRLQLERKGISDSLLYDIVDLHLEELGKNQHGLVALALGIPAARVISAFNMILDLNPYPGNGFSDMENLTYITPDVLVLESSSDFEIVTNDCIFPVIRLNGYYRSLLGQTQEEDVHIYLKDKITQASWAIKCIEQRRSTLLSCARQMLHLQKSFFRNGPRHLAPLTMAEIADRLEFHESTVSRAIKDKYLQCSWGIFSFRYFFSRALGKQTGEMHSPEEVKILIKEIILGENSKKPYCDERLADILTGRGIEISRRTVSKYHKEMGIFSALGRKNYAACRSV